MYKVYMNDNGEYLKWRSKETRASPVVCYEWVDDINEASVSIGKPGIRGQKWDYNDDPYTQIVTTLPVKVVTTRSVTILRKGANK